MINQSPHTFHIPVMGLGFTVDTPLKVARYGISSVMSIAEDNMMEQLREYHSNKEGLPYTHIPASDLDHRARRITAYLDMINKLVTRQQDNLVTQEFTGSNDIDKYFQMLPETSKLRILYKKLITEQDEQARNTYSKFLRFNIKSGNCDVNIMTKCDKPRFNKHGEKLPYEYSDAAAALRGFANSTLNSSIVFSAGLNPRLFSYLESFDAFFPSENNELKKTIILKVSDFRSAEIQGKFLAKKGLWVSEFRIESGLNCGGHVFPTDGHLMGPILEQFKNQKETLRKELFEMVNVALKNKQKNQLTRMPELRISVQGGIGTSKEHSQLLLKYTIDSAGWGSPFMLVPEVVNIDQESLSKLSNAVPSDYFLSYASPLGIGFNNFKHSSGEIQRKTRINKGRPGSPCYKDFISFNSEFTAEPICTASRKYQFLKLMEIEKSESSEEEKSKQKKLITEKDCLCEGLASSALIVNNIKHPKKLEAVTLCPGPNLAYFSKVSTLREMTDHIYGRVSLLNSTLRNHMFINELNMYIDHYSKQKNDLTVQNTKAVASLESMRINLSAGIQYYLRNLEGYEIFLNDKLSEINEEFEESLSEIV